MATLSTLNKNEQMAKTSMTFGNRDGIYTSCSIGHTCLNTTSVVRHKTSIHTKIRH